MIWFLEPALWSFLIIFDGLIPGKLLLLCLVAKECFPNAPPKNDPPSLVLWRRPISSTAGTLGNEQGYIMGTVLFPVLWKLIISSHDSELKDNWKCASCLGGMLWAARENRFFAIAAVAWLPALPSWIGDLVRFRLLIAMSIFWYHSIAFFPSMHRVFTAGEWYLVTQLAATAFVEYITWDFEATHHGYIALTGTSGCIVASFISPCVPSLWAKIAVMLVGPLLAVEGVLRWHRAAVGNFLPIRSATWLLNFLSDSEGSMGVPRWLWLVYWATITPFMLYLSPSSSGAAVVVTRKWFHFVALILFLPVTLFAPELMSLSYAIALCALFGLECLKSHMPSALRKFYQRYLDPGKDAQQDEGVIISHMALIAGCALPLWIQEALPLPQSDKTAGLLPVWGILVLGVGDSAGALVGTYFGRHRWPGGTGKTIEGSLAMWASMLGCCSLFQEKSWIAATFVALLEAATMQIDNIVLPLAGAAVLLMENMPS